MKLSIIIPVYNAAQYLCACLDSVLAQTFTDFEVICVDDGSTDGSGAILDEYAKKDSRFVIIHQKNAGAWAARNVALDSARGEWVTFVDADDVLNPHWLDEGMRIADASRVDIVRMNYTLGSEVPDDFFARAAGCGYSVVDGERFSAGWIWDTMTANGFLWLCFIRRELIENTRFLPAINCKEDGLWLLEFATRVRKIAQGEFNGYFYRMVKGSLTKCNRKASQCLTYLNAMKSLYDRQCKLAFESQWLGVLKKNVRWGIDHDVIEWVMKRARPDDVSPTEILAAYRELEMMVVGEVAYADEKRYGLGFWWWRKTGQTWAIRLPGAFFLILRKIINTIKFA